ncbi:Tyrosine-protein phosphatase 10D [Bulinus truncatus]|nr:Tyrosine-protein phosphatase 10D [Bulinus truncatus]
MIDLLLLDYHFFVSDYDNTFVEFPNLKAFWSYSVQIRAATVVGITNWTHSVINRTLPNTPGTANFNVSQDNVVVVNQNYSSKVSSPVTITVEARKPTFDLSIIQEGSQSTSSEVQVTLCVDCILDKRQGTITKAGLAVCLDVPKSLCYSQTRRKRSTTPDEYSVLKTWQESKSNNFASPYRTTPDNWLETLRNFKNVDMTYTIGNETSCKSNEFCNGPLPESTKISVTIIVCTAAGCSLRYISNLKTKAGPTDNVPAIVGGVVGGILGLALIAAVVFLIIYFKRRPGRSRPHSSPFMELDRQSREVIKEHRPIKITEFKDQVKRLHKDSNLLFQDEFEDIKKLSSRFLHTSDEAKKESNRVKNRYVDILPYDHSRVKLEVQPEDDETMDFVNANYIPGYNSVREYIATQGPMHCTVPDFWKMVWEQKSRVIVMLSDLTEQGKPKVTLYWPENLGEPINYGNVIVEMTNFSQLNKYIIRNFKLAKGSETRKVTHFFLPGWWDFSANLTTGDVLEFAQLVRQEATPANSGPIIVHCSAGVGRTGTFIALDYFMQYIERHSLLDSVDVFSYVMKMRNNRPRMVQAETQYIFIFDALDEVIDRKIKYEQEKMNEHIYNNGGGDLYANMPTKVQEDSIYANTEVIKKEKNGIDNKAFEADYENMSLMADKSETPTTVLYIVMKHIIDKFSVGARYN